MHPFARVPYLAAAALAEALAHAVPAGRPKWRRALAARRNLRHAFEAWAPQRDRQRPLVWFHAPSVGETLQALPVITLLRDPAHAGAMNPPQVAATWFSPSVEAFADRIPADFKNYLPFDTPRAARYALDALAPNALVFSKLDVWPILTLEATRRGIPVGMIAATLSRTSGRTGRLARAFLRDAYASLVRVGAVGDEDATRLIELGVRPDAIRVTGDTRFDQVWERVQGVDRDTPLLATFRSDRPTVVAGSTWSSDEAPLLAAWKAVLEAVPHARLIIAPHEPSESHSEAIIAWAARSGLRASRIGGSANAAADVIVVDRVGVLAELYTLNTVAYVGGGFHRAGLHSVLEPAAAGAPVLFGPLHTGSRDALALIRSGGGVAVTESSLPAALKSFLSDRVRRDESGRAALNYAAQGRGAARRALDVVTSLIQSSP